jgi:transcriptional regulator with XRE-family HTH domain
MGTPEAILSLRDKLGMSQKELAHAIAAGARSVSRYEGGYEPGPKILKRLADLAEARGLDYLREIFAAKMRGDIISRVEKLPSAGSARRVPVQELRRWADAQKRIIAEDSLDECKHVAYTVLNEISPYATHIPEPAEINRLNAEFWGRPENEGKAGAHAKKSRRRSKR